MQIIIIGKRGDFRSVTISRFWGYIAGVLSASIVVGFVAMGVSVSNHDVIDGQIIDNWQSEINLQRADLDDLQQQAIDKNGALAQQLSKMQGRLLRVEALAAHMRDASGLQADEFDFDQPHCSGRPTRRRSTGVCVG